MAGLIWLWNQGAGGVPPVVEPPITTVGLSDGADSGPFPEIVFGPKTEWKMPKAEKPEKKKSYFLKHAYPPFSEKPPEEPKAPKPNLKEKPVEAPPEPLRVKFTPKETLAEILARYEQNAAYASDYLSSLAAYNAEQRPLVDLSALVSPERGPQLSNGAYPLPPKTPFDEDAHMLNVLTKASLASSDDEIALALSEL